MPSAVIHDRTCPAHPDGPSLGGGVCDCGAAVGSDEVDRRSGSRLPEAMAVVPGRLLEMTALLEIDPIRGVRLGASSMEKALRVLLEAEYPERVMRRVRIRVEVEPPEAA